MPIHPELRALDEELAPFGGAARAIMDDAYAIGPPEVVFPALKVLVTPPTHPRAGSPPQSPEGLAERDCRRVRDVRHLSWGLQSYFRQMGATFFHSHPPDGGSVPKQCSRFVPISAISYLPALATARFYNYI